jgi:hypothetical protein
MLAAINTYTGGGVRPIYDTEGELTSPVVLPAAKLLTAGTVLGQVLGTGTDVNEVQTITPGGTVSGGSYQIVYDGEITAAIAFNAAVGAIQTALEALPSIGAGGIVVSGAALNAGNVVLTFSNGTVGNPLGGKHHPLVSVINNLTGTSPTATPSLTTLGKPAAGYWDAYLDSASGAVAGLSTARRVLQYDARTDSQARAWMGTDKNGGDNGAAWLRAVPAFFAGTFRCSDLTGLDANGVTDLGRLISGDTSTLTATTTILRIG